VREEQPALDNNLVTMHWNELSDLSGVKTREELAKLYRKANPAEADNAYKVGAGVGQVLAFRADIKPGDLAIIPLKTRSNTALAIGEVTGPYVYRTDWGKKFDIRSREGLSTDLPRARFEQDLLDTLAAKTVYEIKGRNAEQRFRTVLAGKADPGATGGDDTEIESAERRLGQSKE